MLTHTLVHVLELVVCALFVLLFVQIYRGYRKQALQVEKQAAERAAAAAAQISARARESILGQRVTSSAPHKVRVRVLTEKAALTEKRVATEKLAAEKTLIEKPRLVKESVTALEPVSARETTPVIKPQSTQAFANLNAANGISATPIKASEILLNDYIGEFFSEPVKAADIMPFKNSGSELASAVGKPLHSEAVDLANVATAEVEVAQAPAVSAQKELEDDLVITVNAESNSGSPSDRVMSDKVVHAMLDEAKLVCVS